MIKASELRIGSLVNLYLGIDDNGAQYKPIHLQGVMNDLAGDFHYLNPISGEWVFSTSTLIPIQLSAKWLLRLGFEKYQWQDAYFIKTKYGHLYIQFYKDRIITQFKNLFKDHKGDMAMQGKKFIGKKEDCEDFKYVHQLQNFFHAITGEELVRHTPLK